MKIKLNSFLSALLAVSSISLTACVEKPFVPASSDLIGIDNNKDGIRDDVNSNFARDFKPGAHLGASLYFARTLQLEFDAKSKEDLKKAHELQVHAIGCVLGSALYNESQALVDIVYNWTINNKERASFMESRKNNLQAMVSRTVKVDTDPVRCNYASSLPN